VSEAGPGIRRPWTPYYGILYTAVGIPSGFVSVTLAYELRERGISVAAIAGLISLSGLPWTWKVLGGPMLDLSLTPRLWASLCVAAVAATLGLLGFTAATSGTALALVGGLSFMSGVATVLFAASINNIVGAVEPETERGAIGGYVQAGNLGGSGLGGGAGLWMAQHAGGLGLASAILAALCLACALPLLTIRAPAPARPDTLRVKTVQLWRQLWAMIRSRAGALALLLNLLPMALGASSNLWAAVAGDGARRATWWRW
jgi:MFS family permease